MALTRRGSRNDSRPVHHQRGEADVGVAADRPGERRPWAVPPLQAAVNARPR
ncbi:MAG: hypothetical protein OXP69_06460 [Spirochaetaceae bacterium]|nr:hypothetical protein [Spirochaetaceae bacterium]